MNNVIENDFVDSDINELGPKPEGFLSVSARFAAVAQPSKWQKPETDARKAPIVDCPKCRGTGHFVSYSGRVLGNCFKCDGSGKTKGLLQDAASVARRESYQAKKVEEFRAHKARVEAWGDEHVDVLKWVDSAAARGFEFAISLRDRLNSVGTLTEGQVAAVRRAIQKSQERRTEQAANAPSVAGEGFQRLLASFETAKSNGLKSPKVRIGSLSFSPAKAESANAGFLYVKSAGEYAGKISPDGRLFACSNVDQATRDQIVRVGRDPLAEAVAHGKATGQCSCCGRELTDPASIAAGIGPICAENFGW